MKKQSYEVFVSIVMTCFNKGRYIKDAIYSIAIQSHMNWEIIFVNDASTDHSLEVIERCIKEFKIKKNRIKIFNNRKNKGCGYSLRKAISHASGELVAVVDADDVLEKDALEITIKTHMDNPKTSLTYSDYRVVTEDLIYKKTFRSKQIAKVDQYAILMLFSPVEQQIRISPLRTFKRSFISAI